MTQPDHSKIINKTAKKIFGVYGIKQKGQSRIWLDDNGWFTTVIEFQPFRGRQGTTLNVGVNFNWYEKEYFSFDIGYRPVSYTHLDVYKRQPVIQIMYEMKVLITKKSKTSNKEYLIITTNGDVKNLNLKN